ncbi:TRAP transporter small permease [Thiolapillus sp.]
MNPGKWLEVFEKTLITVGLGAATLLLFANVVARYLFHSGFTWVLELVQYLFAWVVLIGSAYGFKAGTHLGIDIVVEKFSPQNQKRIALLALGLCLLFVVLVFWYSIQYTLRIYEWGDLTLDLQIPQWIPYLAIPVGLGLMILHLLQVGWEIIQGKTLRIHANEAADALKSVEDI